MEIDRRAAEQGAGFDRHSLPGTKQEFRELLVAYYPGFRHIGLATIKSDYLKGRARFLRGAEPKEGKGRAIWVLFPEFPPKLEPGRESK